MDRQTDRRTNGWMDRGYKKVKIFRIFRYFQLHVQLLTLIWLLVKVQAPGVVVHTSPVPETWSVPHNGATNHSQLSPGIVEFKEHVISQTYHRSYHKLINWKHMLYHKLINWKHMLYHKLINWKHMLYHKLINWKHMLYHKLINWKLSHVIPQTYQLKAHVIPQTYHISAFVEFEDFTNSCILYENIDQILSNKLTWTNA